LWNQRDFWSISRHIEPNANCFRFTESLFEFFTIRE
jgi:hypothetical protein